MDLRLFAHVLYRFRALVALGLVLAVALAFLSYAQVDLDGGSPTFRYREAEAWVSRARVLVTEQDFPVGRSGFGPQQTPSGRFIELAGVYAQLATSDNVKAIMLRDGPLRGTIEALPLTTRDGAALPLISIGAISTTPEQAVQLSRRATAAFREYLEAEQAESGIPAKERVVLAEVQQPLRAELLSGRSKTLPVFVFLAVMLGVVGLAFILENLRPRPLATQTGATDASDVVPERRVEAVDPIEQQRSRRSA